MNYADKIRVLCEQKNISIGKLEHDLGYSNSSLAKLKDKIPVDRLIAVCDYLRVPYTELAPELKKESIDEMNPLLRQICLTAYDCTDEELQKIIDYAEFVLSKR